MAIGGLIGLLDDIAALAKLTAASLDDVSAAAGRATAKAAGVVVDDTAVTPQYLQGVTAERELAIVKKIALGSIRNKLIFILPVALLLNHFLPALLPIILMVGGTYLAFEGAEKVWHKLSGNKPAVEKGPTANKRALIKTGQSRVMKCEQPLLALTDTGAVRCNSRRGASLRSRCAYAAYKFIVSALKPILLSLRIR